MEGRDEFLERCIPEAMKDGKDQEQAAAVCLAMWEKHEAEPEENKAAMARAKFYEDDQPRADDGKWTDGGGGGGSSGGGSSGGGRSSGGRKGGRGSKRVNVQSTSKKLKDAGYGVVADNVSGNMKLRIYQGNREVGSIDRRGNVRGIPAYARQRVKDAIDFD